MLNCADSNDITLASYNAEVESYIKKTPAVYQSYHGRMLNWINTSLATLKKGDRILEVGSGTGRDAAYIHSKGYDITCSDAATAFVKYLKSKGWDAKTLNILKDDIPEGFTMIFANAVVSHFTPLQFEVMMTKIMNALPENGLFVFSAKQGYGEGWITEKFDSKRFVHYWDPLALKSYLQKRGYKIIFWDQDVPGGLPSHTWTDLIIKKDSLN